MLLWSHTIASNLEYQCEITIGMTFVINGLHKGTILASPKKGGAVKKDLLLIYNVVVVVVNTNTNNLY